MRRKSGAPAAVVATLTLAALGFVSPAFAQPNKCGGADIATGPFSYSNFGASSSTFSGPSGSASTAFTVTAPAPSSDSPEVPNVFAGQGQNACLGEALASLSVLGVQKIGDASGESLDTPIDLEVTSGLGLQIASAFTLTPDAYVFLPGGVLAVSVAVTNPAVGPDEYGDYTVKLAAQAPGAGIGVGAGFQFTLSLRALTATDTVPPSVSVTKPNSDEILGVIGVEVSAYDPTGPAASGLASLSAAVSSSGGAVSNQPIALALSSALPVAPGVTVTGTGTFSPVGGAPADTRGTTLPLAFTASALSGIGTYILTGSAADVAGNSAAATRTFNVNYAVGFTKEFSTNPCQSGGSSTCTGQFAWTVNRSNVTSDGAAMFDLTVVAILRRVSDSAVMATHVYGTGDVKDVVKIEEGVYKTNFRRGDFASGAGPAGYRVEIYFLNVDGVATLQATSAIVTF